jgi:transcriptional antiterminator
MFDLITKRFKKLDSLILKSDTGTPRELAKKLGISVRSVYDYINHMKNCGAPISYSSQSQSYYYSEPGQFLCMFEFRPETEIKSKNTKEEEKKNSNGTLQLKNYIDIINDHIKISFN